MSELLLDEFLSGLVEDLNSFTFKENPDISSRLMFLSYPEKAKFRIYTMVDRISNRPMVYRKVKYHYTPVGVFWESKEIESLLDKLEEKYNISSLWKYRKREALVMGVNVYSSSLDKRKSGFHNLVLGRSEANMFLTFLSTLSREKIEELLFSEEAYPIVVSTHGEGKSKVCQFFVDNMVSSSSKKVILPDPPENWNLAKSFVTEAKLPSPSDLEKLEASIIKDRIKKSQDSSDSVEPTVFQKRQSQVISTKRLSSVTASLNEDREEEKEEICQLKIDCESDPELRKVFGDVGFGKMPNIKNPVCQTCDVRAQCSEETRKRKSSSNLRKELDDEIPF